MTKKNKNMTHNENTQKEPIGEFDSFVRCCCFCCCLDWFELLRTFMVAELVIVGRQVHLLALFEANVATIVVAVEIVAHVQAADARLCIVESRVDHERSRVQLFVHLHGGSG